MRPLIEHLYGPWDAEVQQGFHDRWFEPSKTQVILVDGEPVGALGVESRHGDRYVTRIEILPSYQSLGLGTEIIRDLVEETHREGKAVSLHVFSGNRALAIYRRVGFREVSQEGNRVFMRANPVDA
jgi:ribosomal protein S18 acetylase RimI-like enzyme